MMGLKHQKMYFRARSALIMLMSIVAQIAGWKVDWNWGPIFKPHDFDGDAATTAVATVTERPILLPLGYGLDRNCHPDHLLVAFQIVGTPMSDIGWIFVAAFQKSQTATYTHYEMPIGETGSRMLTSQLVPDKNAVEAAFNVKDSELDIAKPNFKNCVETPESGCYALSFAISVGVQAWVKANPSANST